MNRAPRLYVWCYQKVAGLPSPFLAELVSDQPCRVRAEGRLIQVHRGACSTEPLAPDSQRARQAPTAGAGREPDSGDAA